LEGRRKGSLSHFPELNFDYAGHKQSDFLPKVILSWQNCNIYANKDIEFG
jgi:hypothetical protein